MIDKLDKILVEKLKEANLSVNEDKYGQTTEYTVRDFIDFSSEYKNLYGIDKLTEILSKEGLSDYDISQIISFQNQEHITEVTFKFFNKLDLKSENYVSPLSSNDDWLSSSAVKTELLSERYAELITYITEVLPPKDKAEFLAILDRYAAVKSQSEEGRAILEKFKSFDKNSEEDLSLLVGEINRFAKRYSVRFDNEDSEIINIKEATDKSGFILYREGNKVKFRAGGNALTDCVFKESDGTYGLICATAADNTDKQQQLYKFRKALMEHLQSDVIPYIYCDSLITNQSEDKKSKSPNKEVIKNLSENAINSFNLIRAMQVLTRSYRKNEKDYIEDTIDKTRIQLFNDNAGLRVEGLDAADKMKLLENCLSVVVKGMKDNQEFWINNTNQFDIQKKVLLSVCSTYSWLDRKKLISDDSLKEDLKSVLENVNFSGVVNLASSQLELIESTKERVGIVEEDDLGFQPKRKP